MKHLLVVILLCGFALGSRAASLGDPAPALSIERWIKGTPVRIGRGTNLFVVEFWATWCPPCKRSIPHLTELQKKYAAKGVVIVGISDEPATEVVPFVTAQGDNMAYRVAIDTSTRSLNTWYAAYGAKGIPHAFVVDTNGCVIWHGFPSEELDEALAEITGGTYNFEREKNTEMGDRLVQQYINWVSQAKPPTNAPALGEKILTDYTQDWRIAYRLAKGILTEPGVRSRDLPLALRASEKAVELTHGKSYQSLEMQARALFATGKKQEAVGIQNKAIALCKNAEALAELKKFLALYEKGAAR